MEDVFLNVNSDVFSNVYSTYNDFGNMSFQMLIPRYGGKIIEDVFFK